MSQDLTALLTAQSDIHGRMARSVSNLKKMGVDNINLHAVETRLSLLDKLWEKFESQHESIRAGYKEAFDQSEYNTSQFFDSAEITYVQQRGRLAKYASAFKAALPTASPSAKTADDTAPKKTSLPRITLPHFSGSYEDWPSFRDLFLSVIGENAAITNIERFHYLRSCLKGAAEKLIRSLTVTADNYNRAWTVLSQYYENKRELIRSNFATFTAVAKMKGETADELRRVHQAVLSAVNAQESIGRSIESHGMDLFNHLVVELFDPQTHLAWESATCDSSEPPTHAALMNFIATRTLTLNAAKAKASTKSAVDASRSAKTHLVKHGGHATQCALCKQKHSLMLCCDFKAKTAIERKSFVESNKLCANCLGNHAIAKCRSTTNCMTCNSRHHTLLHEAYATAKPTEVSTLSAVRKSGDRKAVLLATARVTVSDRHGQQHAIRVLIDQGSEISIVSEALVQRLRLPRSHSDVSLSGVGCAPSGSTRGKVIVRLTSQATGAKLSATALILPRLSLYEGAPMTDDANWPHLQGLPLADPQYAATDKVELLLGAEICSVILEDGLRKGEPHMPIAQKTSLGWILSGGNRETSAFSHHSSLQCSADDELADLVRRFWEQESEPSAPAALTPDEEQCEKLFADTHERTTTGRYVVRLPLIKPPICLSGTRKPAERLLLAMERKGRQDPQFGELYREFMREYEDLQHMERISPLDIEEPLETVCYLPHHGVLREASTTTKIRVVFNGSQRTRSGDSLNGHLLVGANLLPALADILLRWRWHRYVVVGDIEKMYRQILVHRDDRDVQRILWRHDGTGEVREYRLNTVTYGLACAPFLAIRTLRQLADDERSRYPRGADALSRDCYMDDIVSGAQTLSDAIALQQELRDLCMAGGFPLRKWAANNREILADIPLEHRLQNPPHCWTNEVHSTLGIRWHPSEDQFALTVHPRAAPTFTKRRVLSETARLFDPMGWLAPVIIRAKILIQSAWLKRLDWDSPLPPADARLWEHLLAELPLLQKLRINRWLGSDSGDALLELHGFADASERGYAAVIYLRTSTEEITTTHLLVAKSKVAPVKQVSLPRLELCAAATLTRLMAYVRHTLSLSTAPVFLWSDSRVTLHWITGHSSRWKTFVANRVSLIQQRLPDARWRHVPGRDNPADCASQGIAPNELLGHPLWWTGPAWLRRDCAHWPSEEFAAEDAEPPEQRAVTHAANAHTKPEPELLKRFSSLHRLLRVTAWCLRWRRTTDRTNARPPGDAALTLDPEELDRALFRWLRVIQRLHYRDELAAVEKDHNISHQSPLAKLIPFRDDEGVLRVGGRLKHALLSRDERHPLIIPPQSTLTRLIVESCHRRTLHGGVQLTLGVFRLRYWCPRGRAVVKRVLHRCIACTRWRAATPQPPMGNLPRERITPTRPFLHTGVDYAGPILLRTSKGRGQRAYKAFIAVFVCLYTKAVHLEVVSDYTTDAFLAAFRRFTARRGVCEKVYSDCGTNFELTGSWGICYEPPHPKAAAWSSPSPIRE